MPTATCSLRINDLDSTLGDNDGSVTVSLRANIYSALADFSSTGGNSNGSWSYGWMSTDFTKFNIYTAHNSFMWYGELGKDLTPYIWINNGGTASEMPPGVTSTGGVAAGVPTGLAFVASGTGQEPSALRWTAPVTGNVQVTGQFLPGDRGNMTVGVNHNSQNIWKATDSGSFNLNLGVVAGDTIDFVVYGGYGYGNTPISASISYGSGTFSGTGTSSN